MNRDATDVILGRRDWLFRRTIEGIDGRLDDRGHPWTIIRLDNGREVHISDEVRWVLVEPQIQ